MALTDPHAPDATPLTVEQLKGLRNPFITTHEELNRAGQSRAEQANIVRARVWARTARSIVMPKMLSREFLGDLHRRMYQDVWAWAGKQRTVDTNIGVDFPKIGVELRILFDDARYLVGTRDVSADRVRSPHASPARLHSSISQQERAALTVLR
jgi:fido (protein-threonine AMPylation protein)